MPSTELLLRAHELGLIANHDTSSRRTDSAALLGACRRGELVRLTRGIYLPAKTWQAADATARFTARLVAIAVTMGDEAVFSHLTAAVLHGLPVLGPLPDKVDVVGMPRTGGRSSANVRRREGALGRSDATAVRGLAVTSVARTVADVARTEPFHVGVALADTALWAKRTPRLLDRSDLEREVAAAAGRKGEARLRRVIGFATPLSDSVRESQSRCILHELGFPAPVLQHEWHDRDGLVGYSDFWWPEHSLVGEFDGVSKYVKAEYRNGMTAAEVVLAEKRREDRIRALGQRVVRWQTSELRDRFALASRLAHAGLPLGRPVSLV